MLYLTLREKNRNRKNNRNGWIDEFSKATLKFESIVKLA
jgi:hypothetical protein